MTVVCVAASSVPSGRPKRQQNVDQMLELQRETLAAVNSLVTIQGEIRDIKGAKLELQREMVELKRAEMIRKGWWKDESGIWVCLLEGREQ